MAEIGAGNVNAGAEAVRILDHYSPQVALFVGIAGALKDLKHGDIVASANGTVLNCEFGTELTAIRERLQ